MPSSPGMTMSVSRRSKRSPARWVSATSPSGAAVTSCPPCARARTTKALTALSSSATRILAILRHSACSLAAAADRHQYARRGGIRLRHASAKGDAGAWRQALLGDVEHHFLQLAAVAVAQHQPEPRGGARDLRGVDDPAPADQGGP